MLTNKINSTRAQLHIYLVYYYIPYTIYINNEKRAGHKAQSMCTRLHAFALLTKMKIFSRDIECNDRYR